MFIIIPRRLSKQVESSKTQPKLEALQACRDLKLPGLPKPSRTFLRFPAYQHKQLSGPRQLADHAATTVRAINVIYRHEHITWLQSILGKCRTTALVPKCHNVCFLIVQLSNKESISARLQLATERLAWLITANINREETGDRRRRPLTRPRDFVSFEPPRIIPVTAVRHRGSDRRMNVRAKAGLPG